MSNNYLFIELNKKDTNNARTYRKLWQKYINAFDFT